MRIYYFDRANLKKFCQFFVFTRLIFAGLVTFVYAFIIYMHNVSVYAHTYAHMYMYAHVYVIGFWKTNQTVTFGRSILLQQLIATLIRTLPMHHCITSLS